MVTPEQEDYEVVVAAYGQSPYLPQTLDSVVSCLPESVRVTVLDDASPTDDVSRIAAGYAPRVGYQRNAQNLGTSGSFNEAFRLSRSPYTILVGPDDLLLPGAGEVYREGIAAHRGAAAIQPSVVVIDGGGDAADPLADRIKRVISPPPGAYTGSALANRLLLGNWTYNPAIAWRTDLVSAFPFDESLVTAMDLDRLLRLAFAGEQLVLLPREAFAYRRHAGAVSSVNKGQSRLAEELGIHAKALREARSRNWSRTCLIAQLAFTARSHGIQVAITSPTASTADRLRTLRLSAQWVPSVAAQAPGQQRVNQA